MSAPVRKPVVPAEATQELQASDVLEVLGTSGPAKIGNPRRTPGAQSSSIAPVGLDLAVGGDADDAGDEEVERLSAGATFQIPGRRRRRFKGLVIAVVSGCALILVAAGVNRVVHASDTPALVLAASNLSQATAQAAVPAATAPSSTSPSSTSPPSTSPPSTPATSAPATPAPATLATATTASGGSTGTVRLDRPAKAGRVWLDGKKLTSSSALVSCGTHHIKVGWGRAHSIDVPCGGEIGVSR